MSIYLPSVRPPPSAFAAAPSMGLALPRLIVLSAMLFNAALCFVNTHGIGVSDTTVILAEVVIVSATFAACFRGVSMEAALFIGICLLYLAAIACLRAEAQGSGIEIKTARDLIIPPAFFLLGTCCLDLRYADRIVTWSAVIIAAGAVFEFAFLDVFLRYFDIIAFYASKGALGAGQLSVTSTKLFVSGIRPEGRALLPFLGDHRISSFFLEPVSLGNYGVILFFWALTRCRSVSAPTWLFWAVIALVMVVAADSRFGAYLCVAGLLLAFFPNRASSAALLLAPLLAILLLLGIPAAMPDGIPNDTFLGRMLSSGRLLMQFDWANWLGLGEIKWQGFDSGYAYLIARIGVPGFAALWATLFSIPCENAQARLNRQLTALYLSAILCISYSPLTIKTASLLWFLFGATVADAARRARAEAAATSV